MLKIKPYKELSEMKYGERDIFEHEPVVRNINSVLPVEDVVLEYDEVSLLDEHGYPVMAKVTVEYQPKDKVLDRRSFKLLLNRLRNERMKDVELLEYVREIFREYVGNPDMKITAKIEKEYKQDYTVSLSFRKQNVEDLFRSTTKNIQDLLKDFEIRENFYYPVPEKNMKKAEKEIFAHKELKVKKVEDHNHTNNIISYTANITYLNSYDGFPEIGRITVTSEENEEILDEIDFRKHMLKFKYEYLNEEDVLEYVTKLLLKLNKPKSLKVTLTLRNRGNVSLTMNSLCFDAEHYNRSMRFLSDLEKSVDEFDQIVDEKISEVKNKNFDNDTGNNPEKESEKEKKNKKKVNF